MATRKQQQQLPGLLDLLPRAERPAEQQVPVDWPAELTLPWSKSTRGGCRSWVGVDSALGEALAAGHVLPAVVAVRSRRGASWARVQGVTRRPGVNGRADYFSVLLEPLSKLEGEDREAVEKVLALVRQDRKARP